MLRQVEYYFSEENLARDSFMRQQIATGARAADSATDTLTRHGPPQLQRNAESS